jgi:hypothetical protein
MMQLFGYHLQGYSQYKPNVESGDGGTEIFGISYDHENIMTIVALILFSISSYFLGLYFIFKHYESVREKCSLDKTDKQRFRYKSIFWAVIATISVLDVLAFVFGIYHIADFGFMWESYYQFIYQIVAAMIPIYVVSSLILSSLISCYKNKHPHDFCRCNLFAQIWAVFAMTLMTVILPVLLYGLMLGLLVNPVQIFAWIVVLLLGSLTFGIFLASFIDTCTNIKCENLHCKCNKGAIECMDKCGKGCINCCSYNCKCLISCKKYMELFFLISFLISHLFGVLFVASVIIFSVVYIRVILFIGVDNTGIVSSAGQLFPSLFLALLFWMIKKEYDKFKKHDDNCMTFI